MNNPLRIAFCFSLVVSVSVVKPTSGQECKLEPSEDIARANEALQAAEDAPTNKLARESYEDAIQHLTDELESETEDPTYYVFAARAYGELRDYSKARELIDKFKILAPECMAAANNVLYNLWVEAYNSGIKAYQAGEDARALGSFEAANGLLSDARALNNAGILYLKRDSVELATNRFRAALEVAEDPEQRRTARGNLERIEAGEVRPLGAERQAGPSRRWTGTGDKTTEAFGMESSGWQIRWDVESDTPQAVVFAVSVYTVNGGLVTQATSSAPGPDETYVHEAGRFYIEVTTANVNRWRVEIHSQ